MTGELAVSTLMILMTVAVHGTGLVYMTSFLQWLDRGGFGVLPRSLRWRRGILAGTTSVALTALHGLEIALYALLFYWLGAVPDPRDAIYFSAISYATIGYSGGLISESWRLLGAIEGVNGTLLMGWSVAFFVTVIARLFPDVHDLPDEHEH
ncbi:ion channel [Brevundimonas sp. Root1279]|uniref:ion channel n=1 Tax=Brevundimonas sp. Root1279 TaxID=1736443 RepID=UPI000700B05C|nr:ion channel [Brevundimonas sp. Root1279]KQW82548.1 hypothetical protein ASC65_10025 [Brevundimonas sp. Root1279]